MIIDITARHVDVSDAIKAHAKDKLERVLEHANGVVSAHVILDVAKTRHVAEMIVFGRHLSATVHADSEDLYTSIDRCAEKLRHHLDHHHGRLKDRKRKAVSAAEAEIAAMAAHAAQAAGAAEGAGGDEEEPREVIRLRPGHVKPMTVEEAALVLEAQDQEFLVFRDADSETVHVLYRRRDGNLGLIETGAA